MCKKLAVLLAVLLILMTDKNISFACSGSNVARCVHDKEQSAILMIAQLEDVRSIGDGKIIELLNYPSAAVRARAALALGRIGEPETWLPLAERLDDLSSKVRETAIFALGQLKVNESEEILIGQYKLITSKKEQELILEALGKFGTENALKLFNEVLFQDDPKLLAAASKALGVYGWRMSRDNPSYLYDGPASIISSLERHLQNHHPTVRWSAAYACWRLKLSGAEKGLINALSDHNNIVRLYASKALGAIKSRDAVLPLAKLLHDRDWRVRVEALRGIGTIRDARGVYYIRGVLEKSPSAMNGQEEHIVLAALESLAQLGGDEARKLSHDWCLPVLNKSVTGTPVLSLGCLKALSRLRGLDKDNHIGKWSEAENPQMRQFIALSLGEAIVDDGIISTLLLLANDRSFKVQAAALESLSKLIDRNNNKIIKVALNGLKTNDAAVAGASVTLLEKNKMQEVIGELITAYYNLNKQDDSEARQGILNALKEKNDPRILPLIRYALSDPDAGIVEQAKVIYKKITGKKPPVIGKKNINLFPDDYERWCNSNFNVEILTSRGTIAMQLFSKDAPLTVRNFVTLAKKGYYNRLNFHRVVSDFVIQGGCPRGDGYGGPGYAIRDEINQIRYDRGMLGMALSGKDTGGSQFFITHSPQPHLDGRYVIFGKVTKGMGVVDSIQAGDLIETVIVKGE